MDEKRLLDTRAAIPLVAGAMLGVGIFLVPTQIAPYMPSASVMYCVWGMVGFFCWTGALCYAELGTRFPRTGGDVVYLRELYGNTIANIMGWVIFSGIFTGSIAALAVPLCTFQLPVIMDAFTTINWDDRFLGVPARSMVACAVVLCFTGLNILGLRISTFLQALLTFVPMGVYALVAFGALFIEGASDPPALHNNSVSLSWEGIAVAISGCYFAFSGWNQAGYVAGELHRPERTLPLTVTISVLSITALYLLLNMAFVHQLGFSYLQELGFAEVGTLTAQRIGGAKWGWWMNLLILLGLAGSLNGTILCGARVAYSMAKEGGLGHWFAQYSQRHQPVRVLILQAVIAMGYILSGTFDQLLELVSLAMMVVAVVTAAGVWRFDRGEGEVYLAPRLAPYVFVLGGATLCAIMIYHTIVEQNWPALIGLGILAVTLMMSKFLPFNR